MSASLAGPQGMQKSLRLARLLRSWHGRVPLPAVVAPDRVGRAAHGAGVPVTVGDDGLVPAGGIPPGG